MKVRTLSVGKWVGSILIVILIPLLRSSQSGEVAAYDGRLFASLPFTQPFVWETTEARAITPLETDQIHAAIAYSTQMDEYLVVWENYYWGPADINGRRVNPDGTMAGSIFPISWEGANQRENPAVVYNPTADEYLVVWEYEFSVEDHDIYARRVASDGTLNGNEIYITGTTKMEAHPAVAYDAINDAYLIVWECLEGEGDALSHNNIYGQRVDADGTLLGAPIIVAGSLSDESGPAIVYDTRNAQYLVVWYGWQPGTLEYGIYGQRVGNTGALVGSEIIISNWEYDQVDPRLAFNPTRNEFLVVWEDHHWGTGEDWDIYGQRVNADGTLHGSNFAISGEGENQRENPDVVYKAAFDEYLVVWEYAYSASDHDVYRRRVGGDGTLLEDEMIISAASVHERQPVVAADEALSYMAVWEDERDAIGQGVNLYGIPVQLIGFSGHVYRGEVGDPSDPLPGAMVSLYGSDAPYPDTGMFISSTTTNAQGWYGLLAPEGYEFYHVRETDPSGYISVGATTISGTVRTDNWIEYVIPLAGQILTDNNFWDQTMSPVVFSGYVYEGNIGETTSPLPEVTVELYCSDDANTLGTLIGSTTTYTDGWYSLPMSGTCAFYNIQEADPPDYISVGATSISGTVKTDNWIQYAHPLLGKTLSDNTFWDQQVISPDVLSGYVYAGNVGDESAPLSDVIVDLYCSNDADIPGALIASTTTYTGGWYSLAVSDTCAFYNIQEADPPDHISVGATSISGTVKTNNWIQYADPLEGKTLTGNKFWDRQVITETPDLIITDLWNENDTICYQVMNTGDAIAAGGHATTLFVDGNDTTTHLIAVDLGPGERLQGCFDYIWTCTPLADEVVVWADYANAVIEGDENNNAREESWVCDTRSPMITSGPNVTGIMQNSAVIFWVTNEASDSVVNYNTMARGYAFEEMDPTLVNSHTVTLTGLEPSTTYRFIVQSADSSGNTVESRERTFETLPLPDDIDPTVYLIDPGIVSGTVILTAEALDNIGVEKVEFYLRDELVFTDYTPPYQWAFLSTEEDNGNHILKTLVYDFSGRSHLALREFIIQNIVDVTEPTVNIYHPSENADVSGEQRICVIVNDDTGISKIEFFVDGKKISGYDYPTAPTEVNFGPHDSFWWDTRFLTNGDYRFAVQATDEDGKTGLDTVDVYVRNTEPPLRPKLVVTEHRVTRHKNYFGIDLWIENQGTATASAIKIKDALRAFQPVSDTVDSVTYRARFNTSTGEEECIIVDTVALAPGQSRYYTFKAVPILIYPDPPKPSIGHAIKLSYEGPYGNTYSKSTNFTIKETTLNYPNVPIATAHSDALKEADYLIITNRSRLFKLFQKDNVDTLLSDMAHLAALKNGVLGYFSSSSISRDTIRNLIKPGGDWAKKLHPNFSKPLKGYLLIVGETEIVPAWNMTGWNREWKDGSVTNDVPFTDHPYADTGGNGAPELIVGRIIGNNAVALATTIQTSNRVYQGWPGYSFDRSYALLVSGTDDRQDIQREFTKNVYQVASIITNEFIVDILHWKDYTGFQQGVEFWKRSPGNDVIYYFGHGNVDSWNAITTLPGPPDFSDPSPFVYALACLTGSYENHPSYGGGDYNIAESFLDSGAAVYIGSTQLAPLPHSSEAGKRFFETWDADESIGKVLTEMERERLKYGWWESWDEDYSWWKFWTAEYNLYGDPKFGSAPPGTTTASAQKILTEPTPSLVVIVPDYEIASSDGFDYVTIPDGDLLLQEGQYQIPYYAVSIDYPKGYRVQDVILTDRSGLVTDTGFTIPTTTMEIASMEGNHTLPSVQNEGWFPDIDEKFHWTVLGNPDGTITLIVTLYPFFYSASTTDIEFYKNYNFDIIYTLSSAGITGLTTDRDAYEQGNTIMVTTELTRSGEAQDTLASILMKHYGTEEVIDGLLLSTLDDLGGEASFTSHWDSTGFEPGYYYMEVTLQDTDGNVLDRQTEMFRLGISSGEINSFTVTPAYFDIGDAINISMVFSNTGTVAITGTAVIRVQATTGEVMQEFRPEIEDLMPGNTVRMDEVWNTSGMTEGTYSVSGYVLYDSKATDLMMVTVSTQTSVYLPLILKDHP